MDSSFSSVPRSLINAALQNAIENAGRDKVTALAACAGGRNSPGGKGEGSHQVTPSATPGCYQSNPFSEIFPLSRLVF